MLRGGIADKLGNDYEALWTLAEALRVLRGEADEIRIEPFNEDAKGLEFRITTQERSAWHQCKRRTSSGSWTIAALDSDGVLSAFMRKLADPANDCVFVSSDPAPGLKSLTGKAAIVDSASRFFDSLSKDDELNLQRLAKAWPADQETLFNWLRRVRVETVSEASLKRELIGLCTLLFSMDPETAIERLAAHLDETITHTVTTESFRAAVDALRLGWRARFDETLKQRIAAATDSYVASLPQPIAGVEIETPELTAAVAAVFDGTGTLTVVSGSAGSGKSLALARIVSEAHRRSWPVLGLRIDWFLDVHALPNVGAALVGREENPVGVLGNHADNSDCVLVIDQVDAVSEASGRSGRARDLIFQMILAARYFPRLRVVIACRRYDLDNDSLLKELETRPRAIAVRLKPLDWTSAVQPVLDKLGVGARHFSARQRDVLAVPINLHIFASLASAGEAPGNDLTGVQLFDRLLELRARELRTSGITWSVQTALGSMANWMSNNQVLVAPATVLAAFPGAVDLLSSQGLVARAAGGVQFAHESFFDHVFSADFVAHGASVLALLKSDQQRLFRRTQIRQIFARLRDQGDRPYLGSLREVMDSPDVRYLVKDAVAAWLGSVDSPTSAELQIVESWLGRGQASERLAHSAMGGPGWLPLLIRSGAITRLIAAGRNSSNLAFWMLRNGAVSNPGPVAQYLREWWRGDPERTPELLSWFDRLHPDGSIGELEDLYKDVIAAASAESVKLKFDEEFELGPWLHKKQYALGARLLGWWLARWMVVFSDSHPFGPGQGRHGRYWIKELVAHAPAPFLEAVWLVFVEGLRRERLQLSVGQLPYPTIRLDVGDDSWLRLVGEALTKSAAETPVQAEAYLDALPPECASALWLHLRAIGANGTALSQRLPPLLDSPDLFRLGEHDGEWGPFVEAARASMAFLVESERHRIAGRVMGHRPEYERARQVVSAAREDGKALEAQDRIYAVQQLTRTGQVERAILLAIGADMLGPAATKRLSELQRKFTGRPLPEAFDIRGGWVRSPITPEKAALMSDAHWLTAVRRYAGNERHIYEADGVVGGAEQLANVLQSRVKEQPERFVQLLERLPTDTNPAYARAVLSGLRDSADKDGATAGLRAIRAAAGWGTSQFHRETCWLVQKWPNIGRDPEVFGDLLAIAASGDASDTAVGFRSAREKSRVQDLLRGSEALETSAINGDRGVAWRALAAVLWIDQTAVEPVVDLLEKRMDSELTSVRMCMLEAVNAVVKHDVGRGLSLLERLARLDLVAVNSVSGRHVLQWAAHNHTLAVQLILDRLTGSDDESLRALGLAIEAVLALTNDTREPGFIAPFAGDSLRRRVAAFVAADSLTSGTVGDRAGRWLSSFFEDPEPEVRAEASLVDWRPALDDPNGRTDLALAFLRSPAFGDDPERLMVALEERVDRFPTLAFEAVSRVLGLEAQWATEDHQRHALAVHNLGKMLVALYRAVESDRAAEDRILDLIDKYLASDLRHLGEEIRAYERH